MPGIRLLRITVALTWMGSPVVRAANCSAISTGLKPLTAPFFTNYKGFPSGLYPNGSNKRPGTHEVGGLAQAALVQPRDGSGNIDQQNGKIVLLSIGMSNTTQEFSAFEALAGREQQRNPKLMPVDGAQGGWSADRIVADPDTYWAGVQQRLQAAQSSAAQVQAAWVKLADMNPTLPFPDDARKLQSETLQIVRMAKARFPNLRLVYLSSRIYAGYATSPLNPEPYAYQGGFAMKWLIEAQINADPALDYQSGQMPWLAWGPYLWADGTTPRFDGLVWNCSDLADDGTHPSSAGQRKVAQMLLDFFKGDTTTRPWFVAAAAAPKPAVVAAIVNAAGMFPTVSPGAIATMFGSDLAGTTIAASAIPLPYGLEGTTVDVGGEPAPLYFVSPSQINFVVPPTAKGNTVAIAREGKAATGVTAQIAFNTEGLFDSAIVHADGSRITQDNPARPGEVIELFGTGKGIRNPAILAPEFLPVVRVGGVMAEVQYYGPAGIYPGLDQLNVVVPSNAVAGPSVPVTVQTALASNTVTLAVAF